MTAITDPFDKAFNILRGIIKVERRIMKKVVLAKLNDPIIQVPHIGEEWAQKLRVKMVEEFKAFCLWQSTLRL